MRHIGIILLGLALLNTSTACKKDNPSSSGAAPKESNETTLQERQKLQGAWLVVSIVAGGKPVPDDKVKGLDLKYVFSADKMTVKGKNKPDKPGTYQVNPSTNPKQMDLHLSDGTIVKAIYELQGDALKLCLNVDTKTGADYPSEMASKVSPATDLLSLTREKAP